MKNRDLKLGDIVSHTRQTINTARNINKKEKVKQTVGEDILLTGKPNNAMAEDHRTFE